jgi:hypothetical protein
MAKAHGSVDRGLRKETTMLNTDIKMLSCLSYLT